MDKRKIISVKKSRWLQSELVDWSSQGLISQQQSDEIQAYYRIEQSQDSTSNTSWTTGILVALGALLIGGGVIMLFAHNWEVLGKAARTFLSFLPLVIAQSLCLYTYRQRFTSVAWREASAGLTFMAIAASISLIGQTYHIYGDLERFVITWFALGLPLAYLMRSNLVLILLTALVVWLCTFQGDPYWLLFIAFVPLWIDFYHNQRNGTFYWSTWLATFGFALSIMLSAVYRDSPLSLYPIISLLLMAVAFYGLGKSIFGLTEMGFWRNPLASTGALGIGSFSLILSYGDSWVWGYSRLDLAYGFSFYLDALLIFVAFGIITWVLIRYWSRLYWYQRLLMLVSISAVFAILHFAQSYSSYSLLIIAMNLFILCTSTLIIIRAVELNRALLLNAGLIWMSCLILIRFFDSDIGILIKAFAFILIGSGFIAVNIWFSRQHNKSTLQNSEMAND
ncbi:DUF2157 domain-containing protein [Kangiella sp. HZ709]|uniref:DUF2157 domain-containing protein n=1 Tax=Kangiella sp. HZ709 TaxID=2666328 RepID=UPI0012AFC7FD|nr:DUF2157 domain-containing protein [Kangiella sp. HZ709]MRX27216.1 DUF2157 domain-containing protein [Kangiella sp. HZ709]